MPPRTGVPPRRVQDRSAVHAARLERTAVGREVDWTAGEGGRDHGARARRRERIADPDGAAAPERQQAPVRRPGERRARHVRERAAGLVEHQRGARCGLDCPRALIDDEAVRARPVREPSRGPEANSAPEVVDGRRVRAPAGHERPVG